MVRFEGVGLHTGRPCRLAVQRGAPGSGVTFIRADLPGRPTIQASVASVSSTTRQTVLTGSGATVATVEHLMAALAGLDLWDAVIEVDGPEVPALDGSALPFVLALTHLGSSPRAPLVVDHEVSVRTDDGVARIAPSDHLSVTCTVEFEHPAVQTQCASWDGSATAFRAQVAPARTFGFLDHALALRERGLVMGAGLDNTLVFGPEGPLTPPRFVNEPARHKLLDAIGDLALLGRPLTARVVLERPGHSMIVALVRTLQREG